MLGKLENICLEGGSKDIISEFPPHIIELINELHTILTTHPSIKHDILHAYSEIFGLPLRKGGKRRRTHRHHKRRTARKTRGRKTRAKKI